MFLILANFPFRPATTVSGKTRKSDDVIGFRSVSPSQCPAIRQRCAAASGRCAVTWKKEHFLLFNYARHLAGGGSSSGRRWQPKPPNKKEVTLSAFQSGRCVQGRHLTRRNIVHILIVSINWLRHFFFACAHRLFYRMNDRIVRFNEPIKEFLVLFLGTGGAHFPGSLIPHGIQLRDERSRTFHWFVSASSAERWWWSITGRPSSEKAEMFITAGPQISIWSRPGEKWKKK